MNTRRHSSTFQWTPNRLGLALIVALLGSTVGHAALAASPPVVPPITDPASPEHHVGKVIFVELVTPDLTAARQFYSDLFGWTYRDSPGAGPDYAEAYLNGHAVAGMFQKKVPPREHKQSFWLNFMSVRDVDAAERIAVHQGATELSPPHNLPFRGREAVLKDPQGAVFAMLASSSGDPVDELVAPGEFIWSSLITSDPDKAAGFYQTLFDYDVFDQTEDGSAQHLILATDNYARASANALPVSRPDAYPHWLNFVRVEDALAMTAKLVSLGGRVLVQPHLDRHGGMVAVVADPLGAPFGLIEWADTDNKEVGQ